MQRMKGRQARHFYLWCAIVKHMKIRCVIHENVSGFGDAELHLVLGSLYFVVRAILDASIQGWASERLRQYCVMILKKWFHSKLLANYCIDVHWNTSKFNFEFAFEDALQLFHRDVACDWGMHMLASPEDLEWDRKWASRRRKVLERYHVIHQFK